VQIVAAPVDDPEEIRDDLLVFLKLIRIHAAKLSLGQGADRPATG
jgi:hypothetical protein